MLDITHHQGSANQNHLTPVRTAKIRSINVGKDEEKKESSCTVGGNANWRSHHG